MTRKISCKLILFSTLTFFYACYQTIDNKKEIRAKKIDIYKLINYTKGLK